MIQKLASFLLYFFVRILHLSYKVIELNPEVRNKTISSSPNKNFIYALWHQNLASAMMSEIGRSFACIISASKDGEFLALTLELLGHKTARGSSSRGGKKAMNQLIDIMNTDKYNGANAIDGPRGPAKIPKRGIFFISKQTLAPILPAHHYPEKYWEFKSWDKFRFPKPFSKIYVYYCQPIKVKSDNDLQDLTILTQQLTNILNDGEQKVIEILNGRSATK